MNRLIDFLLGEKITVSDRYASFLNVIFFTILAPMFVVFIFFYSKETSLLSIRLWGDVGWKYLLISFLGSLLVLVSIFKNIKTLKTALALAILLNILLVLFIVSVYFTKISVIMLSAFIVLSFFLYQEVADTVDLYCGGTDSSQWDLDVNCYIQELGKGKILRVSRDYIQCKFADAIAEISRCKTSNLKCQVGIGSRELFFDVRIESYAQSGSVVGFRIISDHGNDWSSFYDVIDTMGGIG